MVTAMADEKELKEQVAALQKTVAELAKRLEPPKPYVDSGYRPPNRIDLVSMPPEAMRDLVNGLGPSVMADIRADARSPKATPSLAGAPASGDDRAQVVGTRHRR